MMKLSSFLVVLLGCFILLIQDGVAFAPLQGAHKLQSRSRLSSGSLQSVQCARSMVAAPLFMSTESNEASFPAPTSSLPVPKKGMSKNMKVTGYFTLWYILNMGYNLYNKQTLNMIKIPILVSGIQLVIGAIYISIIWALKIRPAPELSKENLKSILPLAALHTGSHISAVIGLGAGAVGFVHIVKAAEPIFTALFSGLLLQQFYPLGVYAALIPVVGGVGLASFSELSFSWTSFYGAMGSNVCAASRGVLAKKRMDLVQQAKNMDPGNLYAIMTILAAIMTMPIGFAIEGPGLKAAWNAALAAGHTSKAIWKGLVLSGVFFYAYNEVAFYCLNSIDPVTHAVGNTIKRVVLLALSVVAFNHKLTPNGLAGSATAILGVLGYSLVKNAYAKKAKK